ncbi:hypothetical protein WYO_0161 [Methylobacterium sp. GXF4]|uniref:hypothetical protein n=1 Tax=Methylobacterium sp. GXF4 TaxID=1096546 RepID=UPI0002698C4A|nr:hypothetical protein [Methylobacterium sp. GXF4]EIZ87124.1 hypothetical protein WYO_0161 [Methylobacterium sp. GXF4]
MNQNDIDNLAKDTSSTSQFVLELYTMNGGFTPDQRRAVAEIMQRVCTGLNVQLGMALPEGYDIKLRHISSRRGTTHIDVGDG